MFISVLKCCSEQNGERFHIKQGDHKRFFILLFFTFIPDLEDFPLTIRFRIISIIPSLLSFSIEVCDYVFAIS